MNGLTKFEILALIENYSRKLAESCYSGHGFGKPGDATGDFLQEKWDRVDTLIQALKVLDKIGAPNNG